MQFFRFCLRDYSAVAQFLVVAVEIFLLAFVYIYRKCAEEDWVGPKHTPRLPFLKLVCNAIS